MLVHALQAPSPSKSSARRPAPLPAGVHARLKLGGIHDEAEKQADRMAAQALSRPLVAATATDPHRPAVRKAIAPTSEASHSEASTETEPLLPEAIEREIAAMQSGGQPLSPPLRADMEARFGIDLSSVRIHTGHNAVRLNEALHAHAFAVGDHIAFNQGRYQPDTGAGRFLLAHELAHVAQHRGTLEPAQAQPVRRGFWSSLYDSTIGELGDIASWAWDKVKELGWRLLESISPDFARTVHAIVDEGILHWLGRQVARAWDGFIGTLRDLVPFDGPRELIDLFAGLVERAAAIAAALATGDCEPLMQAIGEMKTFVSETVGVAWDKLTEFLRPIGEFFSGLWNDFGAPALQWLQDFGGAVWQGIQDLGQRFWDWIRPVREAASRVWNWFKGLLFGDGEGDGSSDSQGGVIGWISRKAGEAWDWVKEQTRPVWQPVADFASRIAELIPPAFVREMGEHAQQLSTELNSAADGMEADDGVAGSRDTLASVLPSVEAIIATVRRIIVGAGQWLSDRITGVGELVSGLIGRLRSSEWLSWLAGAFGWLQDAVTSLATWANQGVITLFNWLVQGFDALTPFLQMVLETVRKLITIAGDLLQLPLLILNSIWHRVPACIREPIEEFIKTQVLARIPVFGQFFSDPTLWPRVHDTAMRILRQIFVNGDLAGAAWTFFQAILRIFNVPPELVVRILAKAASALGAILTNPIGFLTNLLRAVGAGFTGFFSNIGRHLLTGFSAWLFSTVREAGIEPPADFSLRSILGFVLQVLGVTVENIFARLSRRLSPAIVARLRQTLSVATGVWSFVSTLVTEGPAGLWRELSERLSNLWSTVVNGVVGFITERVIGWASRWLLSLLDVTGIMPVINTLIAIYHAIESFMEYLRQILEIVNSVLDGINAIASGAIDQAAGFVENSLANALPIAIGFLANQAGLGRLSARLREILATVQERVNAALDWLIDRALRMGRAVIDALRRGAAAVRRGAARLRDWWRARSPFRSADGEEHNVYVEGRGRSAQVMVASNPTTYQEFLRTVTVPAAKQADKNAAVAIARELDTAIAAAARDSATTTPAAGAPPATNHADIIDGLLGRLATATASFMPMDLTQSTSPVYGARVNGFGGSASVLRLTPIHPNGSSPSSGDMGNPSWAKLAARKQGEGVYYIKGHLLNDNLGGPGNTWDNLTPLTQAANSDHKNNFENAVKQAVNGSTGPYATPSARAARSLKSVNFIVTANYGQPARADDIAYLRAQGSPDADDKADIMEGEQSIPVTLDCSAHELNPDGSAGANIARHTVNNTIDTNIDHYFTRPTPKRVVYLNEMSRSDLLALNGVTAAIADDILRGKPFRTRNDIQAATHTTLAVVNQILATPTFEVRIYRR